MCEFLDFNAKGSDQLLILNKDVETDSVTSKGITEIYRSIMDEHKNKPSTPQLNLFFFASHGIDRNAQQHIVLNEFEKKSQFYAL